MSPQPGTAAAAGVAGTPTPLKTEATVPARKESTSSTTATETASQHGAAGAPSAAAEAGHATTRKHARAGSGDEAEAAAATPAANGGEATNGGSGDGNGVKKEEPDEGSPSGDEDDGSPDGKGDRRRKRSRKGLDKKYACPQEGCGKSYSRAEHLYRHQLNHTPKQIYKCDYPDCPRFFVRQDLCARHRERHTTRGSHLQRNNNYVLPPNHNGSQQDSQGRPGPGMHGASDGMAGGPAGDLSLTTSFHQNHQSYEPHSAIISSPGSDQQALLSAQVRSATSSHPGAAFMSPQAYQSADDGQYASLAGIHHRSNSSGHYITDPPMRERPSPNAVRSAQADGAFNGARQAAYNASGAQLLPNASTAADPSPRFRRSNTHHMAGSNASNGLSSFQSSHPTYPLNPAMLPSGYSNFSQNGQFVAGTGFYSGSAPGRENDLAAFIDPATDGSFAMIDGSDVYAGRSPVVMPDDFTWWLFNGGASADFPAGVNGLRREGTLPELAMGGGVGMDIDGHLAGGAAAVPPPVPPQPSMDVRSLIDPVPTTSDISDEKRRALINLIRTKFNETEHTPVAEQKARLLEGDVDAEAHPLSLKSLRTYLGSYWWNFHDQLPILHQPTFSPARTRNLLLLAIVAIGAANLERRYGALVTQAAELAYVIAWHLRGEVFMSPSFRPPAKLWVLQTLLLLECYEKLFSTRILHERAQIHHATTIVLLRRGSALQGRPTPDPSADPADRDAQAADTGDAWFDGWITAEATKRVAVAAFILDSTHATMFSHTAVMLAHEMKLALPCDEALWTEASGRAVRRLVLLPAAKPVPFLDALKRTLHEGHVRTNVFGRTALMAGLLNVTFNLGQRDQLRQLTANNRGERERWRGNLTRAFDVWEDDWETGPTAAPGASSSSGGGADNSAAGSGGPSARVPHRLSAGVKSDEPAFESRVVLHHLAHMGMHVDIVQCQIYAGARRLLGRQITPTDYHATARRMRDSWAPRPSARDAVFYSLRFLAQVLARDLEAPPPPPTAVAGGGPTVSSSGGGGGGAPAAASTGAVDAAGRQCSASSASGGPDEYAPNNDYLLNRPWVLYFAALVVWAYGFALDGPLSPPQRGALPPSLLAPRPPEPRAAGAMSAGGAAPPPVGPPVPPAPLPAARSPAAKEEQLADLRRYMRRVGGVDKPDDLERVSERNGCLGLLLFLAGQFGKCRWELMHEAARLLRNCADMLLERWEVPA